MKRDVLRWTGRGWGKSCVWVSRCRRWRSATWRLARPGGSGRSGAIVAPAADRADRSASETAAFSAVAAWASRERVGSAAPVPAPPGATGSAGHPVLPSSFPPLQDPSSEYPFPGSKSCGIGFRTRSRECANGILCDGTSVVTDACDEGDCPSWEHWTPWGRCSSTCGGGTRTRRRFCSVLNTVEPDELCGGSGEESSRCNEHQCQVRFIFFLGESGVWTLEEPC